jgi:uncharacterized membrane protein
VTPEEQERFDALERRVAELERRLLPKPKPVAAAPRPAAKAGRGFESRVGVNWISRISVVTVALALAFFFEYAFENRWITEPARVGIGLAFAAAALAAGERFWRSGQRAYGQSLAAAGIAFLYLSFWAAFALYRLIPQGAAFALMALATGAAGWLALRYGSQAVALLGLAGGFATPLLLHGAGEAWFVLGYAVLLDGGAVWVERARGWRRPAALALAGTVALYLQAGAPRPFFAIFVAAYFALFARTSVFWAAELLAGVALVRIWTPEPLGLAAALAFAVAGVALRQEPGSFAGFWLAYAVWRAHAGAPAAALPLAIAAAGFLLYPADALRRVPLRAIDLFVLALDAAFFFGAAYNLLHGADGGLLAIAVAAVYGAAARRLWTRDRRSGLLAAGIALVLLVLAAPVQLTGYRITMAWSLEAAAAVWIGLRLAERRAVYAGLAVFGLAIARLALFDSRLPERFPTFAVTAASLWAAAWWIRTGRTAQAAYVAGHAVMLWGLGLEAIRWAQRAAPPASLRSVESTAVSVVAAGYAVLLVAGGTARRHSGSRLLGVGLIGLVVAKLYLYDVWLLSAFYRMAAFAILGVLLLVVSFVYSRRARA